MEDLYANYSNQVSTQQNSFPDGSLISHESNLPKQQKKSSVVMTNLSSNSNGNNICQQLSSHSKLRPYQKAGFGIARAPSLDSANTRNFFVTSAPLVSMSENSDSDHGEEFTFPRSGNILPRGKVNPRHELHNINKSSHSLPVTPRISYEPHNRFPPVFANRTTAQYVNNTHYFTCPTALSFDQLAADNSNRPDLHSIESVDYLSLPLPTEAGVAEPQISEPRGKDFSRHYSEPCLRKSSRGSFHGNVKLCVGVSVPEEMGEAKSSEESTVEAQWGFIQTLMTELNDTKQENRKLKLQLHQSQLEIKILKNQVDVYAVTDFQPGYMAELVGQIHAAQKVRDEAMMARVKFANNERDVALCHSRHVLKRTAQIGEQNVDWRNYSASQELPDASCDFMSMATTSTCVSSRDEWRLKSCEPSHSPSSLQQTRMSQMSTSQDVLSDPEQASTTLAHISALEDELRMLRLATTLHESPTHEGNQGHPVATSALTRTAPTTSSSEDDPKESLSSLESVETTSASSWKNVSHFVTKESAGGAGQGRGQFPGVTIVGPVTEL